MYPAVADDTVAELIKADEEKNAAFVRGDMDRWAKLTRIAPDFTLMQPLGDPPATGSMQELAQYFRNGKTKLEVAQTYASDRLVVLVMIERQHAEVGGLPDQEWSLRVTEVYRRDGRNGSWRIVMPTHSCTTLPGASGSSRGRSTPEWLINAQSLA